MTIGKYKPYTKYKLSNPKQQSKILLFEMKKEKVQYMKAKQNVAACNTLFAFGKSSENRRSKAATSQHDEKSDSSGREP